jgi:hypothetical protein
MLQMTAVLFYNTSKDNKLDNQNQDERNNGETIDFLISSFES